jgi:molecular chaperone HscC
MSEENDSRYLVFDLGGGTFDVSVLELYQPIMEVHAIAGDNFIGGEDFTDVLYDLFLQSAGIAPESLDLKTRSEVRKNAENCKCAFSHSSEIIMCCTIHGQMHILRLTLEEYERACAPLLERLRKPIERSLRDAGVSLQEIDQIVLVGGATRSPVVRRFVAKLFGRTPSFGVNPDEAVAIGAALQCGIKSRDKEIQEVVLTDVCPFTLGTEVMVDNGVFEEPGHYLPIIERNTVIPVSRTETVYTAHENQTRITVKILQGESRMSQNNLLLGELSVPVPAGPKGKEAVDITYTYDVNSLLEVEVYVHSSKLRRKILIQGSKSRLSQEEAEKRMEALQYLKQNPRDEEPNRLVLLRGERLYEEATGELRRAIDRAIMEFDRALKKQDRTEIESARKKLEQFLDETEYRS